MNTTDSEEASEATTADYQQVDKVIKAVQYGDLKFVETAVEVHHVSVDTKDGDDCSLLHWAAINNRVEIIEFLLHRKANVNCVGGENKEIPLQWAVRQAHCAPVVQLLISEKSNIHHKSVHGYDALFLAAQACHVHIAYLLLVAHANVDTVDLQNDTPLYWLLRYQTDQNSLDMQRLLIRFNASVSHRGSNDRVALHYVIENVRAFDLHSAYLIYMANHSPAVLEAKDIHGQTPSQVAWRLRSSKAVRFLFDAYMYAHLPKWLPIGVTAASLFSFFLYLKAFDWLYGGLLFVLTEIAADSINQKYILRANSRMSCGFAWGVIISATWAYYRFVSKHLNFFWDGLISIWVVCIVYTLWKSMTTSPQVLRGEEDETSTRTMVSKITEAQSILDINGKSVGVTFKLCTTCLVDKSLASTHCNQCDHCAVSLDHHCPFVNNCVGKGNRRIFCLFTFFAGTGCLLMAMLSLYVQHYVMCLEAEGMIWGVFAVQLCAFHKEKTLLCATWLSFFTGLWILSVLLGQLGMVASETTTFEVIKRGNQGVPVTIVQGVRNIIKFLQTGQYYVTDTPAMPPRPCCAGHGHGVSHGAGLGVGHGVGHGGEAEETARLLSGIETGSGAGGNGGHDPCNTTKLRSGVTELMAKAQMFNNTDDD